jgi:hypothetical protein
VLGTLLIAIVAMVFWLGPRSRGPPDLRPTAAVLPFEANMIGGDNDNYSAQSPKRSPASWRGWNDQRGVVHQRDAVRGVSAGR